MERIINKTDFYKLFFKNLKAKYDVIGPTKIAGATGTASYATFGSVDRAIDLEMGYETNMLSPRKIFSPDNEPLYKFEKDGQNVKLENLRKVWDKKKVIIGLHACDITALARLDKVETGSSFVDEHYQDRRRKSIIIGLTCDNPGPRCFCSSVGAGPDIESGYDLLLTDIGESFFCRTGTDFGKKLISANYFKNASDRDKKLRDKKLKIVEEKISKKFDFDIDKVTSALADRYNDKLWEEFSDKCYACGACNMICPTCNCFTVIDKTTADNSKGERVLVWDSCHFTRFAQIAGNLNLREEKTSRFKHRIYDKFHYSPARYGMVSCVGCGRCAQFCPSHIQIQDALMKL